MIRSVDIFPFFGEKQTNKKVQQFHTHVMVRISIFTVVVWLWFNNNSVMCAMEIVGFFFFFYVCVL